MPPMDSDFESLRKGVGNYGGAAALSELASWQVRRDNEGEAPRGAKGGNRGKYPGSAVL